MTPTILVNRLLTSPKPAFRPSGACPGRTVWEPLADDVKRLLTVTRTVIQTVTVALQPIQPTVGSPIVGLSGREPCCNHRTVYSERS